jgi:hypothetical protein
MAGMDAVGVEKAAITVLSILLSMTMMALKNQVTMMAPKNQMMKMIWSKIWKM